VFNRGQLLWAIVALLAVLAPPAVAARPFQPGAAGFAHRPVCKAVPKRQAHCNAEVVVDATGAPLTSFTPLGYGPGDLQSAYGLTSLAASEGATQTIAIVDAYDDPNAEADLAVYRSQYGLPACTTANGCFRKVDQRGGVSYPAIDASWAQEISLDLDMASAVCPNCHILLVESDSAQFTDLVAAVDRAALLGATQISNSYGGGEYSGETTAESHYNHPGIAVTVSSGDSGYGVEFPASSRYVTAVGGTSLNPAAGTRGWSETAWSGAGSGCSAYIAKPAWQTDSGCSRRSVVDVSAVADPNTGVAVYDSLAYQRSSGWMVFGGTSAASPIVAAFDALIGPAAASRSYVYDNAASFNDVVSGSNGNCGGSYLCTARAGYDGPTGVGTPTGAAPLSSAPIVGTQAATLVSTGGAQLNGTVNPGRLSTTYHFEYGATTAYGSRAPAIDASAGSGTVTIAESTTLGGLPAGTTYHYRLVATNSAGTVEGADQMFTTLAPPAAGTSDGSGQTVTTGVEPTAATPPATAGTPPAPQPSPPAAAKPPSAVASCTPTLAIKRRRRMAILTVRCAPAGSISASVLRGKRRLVRAHRTRRAAGTATLRLRIARRAFGSHRLLKLTFKVTVVDATGARRVLHRHVKISR
jgi:hypothetical protein